LQVHLHRCAGLLALLIAVAGCDSSEMVPLHGSVQLDGRPLSNATVQFFAQDPGGKDAMGFTDAEGVFRLSTDLSDDGVFPGSYKVTVQPVGPANSDSVATNALEALGETKRNRPLITLPARYSQLGQTVLLQEVPARRKVIFELQSK
jgi:hypothetical protein